MSDAFSMENSIFSLEMVE